MDFLKKAELLMPTLKERTVRPIAVLGCENKKKMRKGDSIFLDFGEHLVGNLTFSVDIESPCGPVPDSPLRAEFHFAERMPEFEDKPYNGTLSESWIQKEIVNIDYPLFPFELPRRYAFRYVKITFTANTEYSVIYKECFVKAITSADTERLLPLRIGDELLKKIDAVSINTLKDCMQLVFEDGPKRDRRLWLGDLYLQAKANYVTFKNYDLVKRCLYLFAGLPHEDGCLSSAVYYEPILNNQAWILHDYALLFIGTLADYYRETGDMEALKELWPVAYRQTEIAHALDDQGYTDARFCFIDWCDGLDKTCAGEAIYLAMLKEALFIANICGTGNETKELKLKIEVSTKRLLSLYDKTEHVFKGASGQVSIQSNMWGVIADVLPKEEAQTALKSVLENDSAIKTVTPYAMHFLIQALYSCGLFETATTKLREYWGAMLSLGADTFWEVFVPEDLNTSPYGDVRMNSFCHAWSCTPTYFIRKYCCK